MFLKQRKNIFSKLYFKIVVTFLTILVIVSAVYFYIAVFTAEMYYQEANQKLNKDVAIHIVDENQIVVDGKLNEDGLQEIFRNVMVINPSIEVYLLDKKGNILNYFAPNKKIILNKINLDPLKKFIGNIGNSFLLGQDPKKINSQKAFSAAPIYDGPRLYGYIYVVLEGEQYENASQLVFGSYILRLGIRSMSITLFASALISFIAIAFITRNIRKIVKVIRSFKNGDLSARIKLKDKGELNEFADAFNEMADTIVQNIDEMKTMDNLRRELVANVSHDLRTPLSAIQGYLETIQIKADKLTEDEKTKYMNTVLKSTERLKKLVEELFELSKLEAKERTPSLEGFSIAELVQDIHQKNTIIAETNKIDFSVKLAHNLPQVYADIGMMEKVIQNLLDNAFKFTPQNGRIIIRLESDKEYVNVSVEDSGSGINQDDLNNIFNRYNKVVRSGDKENQGLGLGLTIVKKILEVHQLNINVSSPGLKGAKFSFQIPIFKYTNKKKIQIS